MADDLWIEVEDQLVSGTGGEGFTGLFNTTGTQTLGPPAGGLTEVDLVRRAVRLIRVNARTQPIGILVHSEDAERWDTTKNGHDEYLLTDPRTGGRRAEVLGHSGGGVGSVSDEGRSMVGDFRKAVLFDREDTVVTIGTADQAPPRDPPTPSRPTRRDRRPRPGRMNHHAGLIRVDVDCAALMNRGATPPAPSL